MNTIPYFNEFTEPCSMRDLVSIISAKYDNKIAFSYRKHHFDVESVKVSFRQLAYDVKCFGTEAISRGMTGGAHCAVIGKLSYHWVLAYLALQSVGAVVVPLDKDWSAEDLADTVRNADCRFLLCDGDLEEKAAKICETAGIETPIFMSGVNDAFDEWIAAGKEKVISGDDSYSKVPVDAEALSLLVYTSGTTGQGKGVMLSQKAILSDVYEALRILRTGEKMVGVLPPHHTFGSTIGFLTPIYGGSEIYISSGIRYLTKELQAEKPDALILVPLFLETFARKIRSTIREKGLEKRLNRALKLSNGLRRVGIDATDKLFASVLSVFGGNIKMIACGGAPLSQDVYDFYTSLGITILNGYGITECAPLISCNRIGRLVPGSVGDHLPSDKIKIDYLSEEGEGEICVSGPNVMMGYYKNEQATADCIDGDGYFHTGDIGKIDKDGILYITGRMKNLIILSNGKNVYPEEIESVLCDIPGVLDVVVYEGASLRGVSYNAVVAEFYMDPEYVLPEKAAADVGAYLQEYVDKYNKTAVSYKKIGLVRVRTEEFPKNTLRKIVRFKIDKTID